MSKVFIDTNILVYALDKSDAMKMSIAREHLKTLAESGTGVISTQVMQEFFVASTKKLKADPFVVRSLLHSFEHFEVITVTPEIIKEAIDCHILNRLSFWDSLIVSTAESGKCAILLTEDLQHGQNIRGVKIQNPFAI